MHLTRKRATLLFLLLVGVAGAVGMICAVSLTGFVIGQYPDEVSYWFERGEHGLLRLRFALAFSMAAGLTILGALLSCRFGLRRPLVRRIVLLLVLGLVASCTCALHLRALASQVATVPPWAVPPGLLPPKVCALNRVTWVPLFGGVLALVAGVILYPFPRRKPIRPGTRLVSRAAVRVRVVTFSDPFDEGIPATLAKGEIVRVECKAPKGVDGHWLVPERREQFESRFVPRWMRLQRDYEGYALLVSYDDLARRFRPFDPITDRPTVRAPGRERRE